MSKIYKPVKTILLLSTVFILCSCTPVKRYGVSEHSPLFKKTAETSSKKQASKIEDNTQDILTGDRFKSTPKAKYTNIAQALNQGEEVQFEGDAVSLNVDSLPLPAFINEVFGNILNQSFQIAPRLQNKKDLVTLRIVDQISRKDLYYTTKRLLETYGVATITDGEILRFVVARSGQTSEPPLFVTGQTLPNVPVTHRPIFQVITLKIVKNNNAVGWLKNAFSGQSLKITQDAYRNAIWLQGKRDEVLQAAEVIRILDQPLMRSKHSIRIEPLFLGADRLTDRLIEVLLSEGYDATKKRHGTINFLPIEETNSIIVFASDIDSLEHVKQWVIELDKPMKNAKTANLFIYRVQNTAAKSIVEVLQKVESGPNASGSKNTSQKINLVIDESRNSILFKGYSEEWASLLPIIKQMDQPDLQVLIEVVVAEVTLSEDFSFGIDWAIDNASLVNGGTDIVRSALNIGSGGLSYFPMNSSGSTRAVLNMLATNSNVKLLQTPRLLVRSGKEASINVGDEVPIVTSQTTANGQQVDGSTALTQSVKYRRTGNTLSIKPVVYAGGMIDIQISQEISSAQATSTSGLDSPTILNRSLKTSLTVQDGGSVLIGGLIQTIDTEGESRVPFLSDIPFIGKLFTQKTINTSRTELMVLIVPYVIRNNKEAESITRAFRTKLKLHD